MTLGSDVRPLSPPPHILPDPQKGAPYHSSRKERCSLSGALQLSLKLPVNGLRRFPNRPLHRETPVSRAFFYTFPSKSPVSEPPPHVLQQGPHGERSLISRDNGLFIYLYLSESPTRSAPTKKMGKYLVHVDGRPTYNGVRPGSPRGQLGILLIVIFDLRSANQPTIPGVETHVDQCVSACRISVPSLNSQ